MIISVADSMIPSFGGLKEIDLQSSPTARSTGGIAPNELLIAEVNNKLPSSISKDGILGTLVLFVSIQYPFEQTGIGYNWGDPANHAKPPVMTLVVNKTSLNFIQNDVQGCPIVEAYTLSLGSWTNNGLGEISSKSINSTQCQIKIQSQHYSKFAFSLKHISSIKSPGLGQFGVGTVVSGTTSLSLAGALNIGTVHSTVTTTLPAPTSYNISGNPGASFSNLVCSKEPGYALMTGQYTSGSIPYKVIFLKMTLLDNAGHVLATGNGHVSDINTNEVKSFNAISRFSSTFTSCTVQVDTMIPK